MMRYKDCTRLIKCYRWLHYKPLAFVRAIVAIIYWWVCTGATTPEFMYSRHETLSFIWRCHLSMADLDMCNYVTLHEAITELKERHNADKQVANAD